MTDAMRGRDRTPREQLACAGEVSRHGPRGNERAEVRGGAVGDQAAEVGGQRRELSVESTHASTRQGAESSVQTTASGLSAYTHTTSAARRHHQNRRRFKRARVPFCRPGA